MGASAFYVQAHAERSDKEGVGMYLSLALLLFCGLLAGLLFSRLKLPSLLGMMLAGILIGPSVLNLFDSGLLAASATLRTVALLLILIRAGLSLDLADLKRAGRPAMLLCFLPATFEIAAFLVLGSVLFHLSAVDSLLLGCVMAAVSPAVVVPGMIEVMDHGYGKDKAIPQMILAGSSADDIYVLVLFSIFLQAALDGSFHPELLLRLPSSILLGIAGGFLAGAVLARFYKRFHSSLGLPGQVIGLLACGLLLYGLEQQMDGVIGFSGLIAAVVCAMKIRSADPQDAARLSGGFNALWKGGEIVLFVLIGAAVDLNKAWPALPLCLLALAIGLCIRSLGVLCALIGTPLSWKEKLFCVMAELPKATVQAAIGAIPLVSGLGCGQIILSMAVVSILFSAPLGAILIHRFYPVLLSPQGGRNLEDESAAA